MYIGEECNNDMPNWKGMAVIAGDRVKEDVRWSRRARARSTASGLRKFDWRISTLADAVAKS